MAAPFQPRSEYRVARITKGITALNPNPGKNIGGEWPIGLILDVKSGKSVPGLEPTDMIVLGVDDLTVGDNSKVWTAIQDLNEASHKDLVAGMQILADKAAADAAEAARKAAEKAKEDAAKAKAEADAKKAKEDLEKGLPPKDEEETEEAKQKRIAAAAAAAEKKREDEEAAAAAKKSGWTTWIPAWLFWPLLAVAAIIAAGVLFKCCAGGSTSAPPPPHLPVVVAPAPTPPVTPTPAPAPPPSPSPTPAPTVNCLQLTVLNMGASHLATVRDICALKGEPMTWTWESPMENMPENLACYPITTMLGRTLSATDNCPERHLRSVQMNPGPDK